MKPREIYAWVNVDPGDHMEKVVLVPSNDGGPPIALATTERRMAEVGSKLLQNLDMARRMQSPIRLVRYREIEVIEVIYP